VAKLDHLEHVSLGPGWEAFAQPDQYVHAGLVLITATLSGVLLAYHPVYRGRPLTFEHIEQRKTLVLYSSVGALIAVVCTVAPSMAFVIFGIGGLMRFRTNTGESKTTGHTIVGTLIGLCWGLGLQLVAVLATVYFWLTIYLLERTRAERLTVAGVSPENMGRAADAYRDALSRAGCRVLSQSKSLKKAQLSFVLKVPRGFGADDVAKAQATLPEELRGAFDWPE
jgi:hypothetical protein